MGNHPRRDTTGRYAVEQLCDACGKPIHGQHVTDSEVTGDGDGPGFFLCERARCGARLESMSPRERLAVYTAQRATNDAKSDEVARDARARPQAAATKKKSPSVLRREIDEFIGSPASPRFDPAAILRDNAGAKASRIIPRTGTTVTLYDAREAGLDPSEGRWRTVCEDHGSMVTYSTKSNAAAHLSRPEEWCEGCRDAK